VQDPLLVARSPNDLKAADHNCVAQSGAVETLAEQMPERLRIEFVYSCGPSEKHCDDVTWF
jgi:phosphoserine phosphatase